MVFSFDFRLSDDEDQASGMTDKDKSAKGKFLFYCTEIPLKPIYILNMYTLKLHRRGG